MQPAKDTTPAVPKDRAELLARSWTEAAELYLPELVPRFAPWLSVALGELERHCLPEGPIVVPCCGPGHELVLLHRMYGGQRAVYGLDLSQGMVDMARKAISHYLAIEWPQQQQQQPQQGPSNGPPGAALDAYVADASCIDSYGPVAGVLSVFGLQQMGPVAPQALSSWVRNLAPGGVAVVMLWPSKPDPGGPWEAFEQAVMERAAAVAGKPPPPPDAAASAPPTEWEVHLTEPALRDVSDAELLVDRLERNSMWWDSPEQLWKVMSEGGPWHARRMAQGDQVMNELQALFLAKMAEMAGMAKSQCDDADDAVEPEQQQQQPQRLEQRPFARLIVIRRRGGEKDLQPWHQHQQAQQQQQQVTARPQGAAQTAAEGGAGVPPAVGPSVVGPSCHVRYPQASL